MHTILHRAQQSVGSWVGSSAIHMGDHNVPNALMFIGKPPSSPIALKHVLTPPPSDKYSQIYRILLPVCNTLSQIPGLADKPALLAYIEDEFGSTDNCIRDVLCDFFRHGFDGSGADNFFDAGSCIDGRLTSAWNWCAQLEKKRYFPVFLLTGAFVFLIGRAVCLMCLMVVIRVYWIRWRVVRDTGVSGWPFVMHVHFTISV